MQRIDAGPTQALFGTEKTRRIEQLQSQALAPYTLMQRAGAALARLAMAVAPHAQDIWLACGPGNNGGDGLQAAALLQAWGKRCHVSWAGSGANMSPDTAQAWEQAQGAGVHWCDSLADVSAEVGLCIDAMLGLGSHGRTIEGLMAQWIDQIQNQTAPVLAVDLPTGLNPDTGALNNRAVRASHTLSLLTLKPGFFTAHGKDQTGVVWLDNLRDPLDTPTPLPIPDAYVLGAPPLTQRLHASHKGSYGDVAIVGGASGMAGAAVLAASAALHAGAGRVYVSLLDDNTPAYDPNQPELMFRALADLSLSAMAVVCGCGAGQQALAAVQAVLPASRSLVLDADALNAIAAEPTLVQSLQARAAAGAASVVTPHPLEAARLLACSAAQVQQDRLSAAARLAELLQCCVVLKGSGTVVCAPGQTPQICPTGNASLASGGTGDVLAGLIGARLAQGMGAWEAACAGVYQHGRLADQWPAASALSASALARALTP